MPGTASISWFTAPASVYDSDAEAFFTAAGITDITIKDAVNTFVVDIKADGIWSVMEAIYPIVGGSSSSHLVNLKNPGTFNLIFNGTWTHSATGMLPNGLLATYAQTGWIPSVLHSDGLTSMGLYSRTNPSDGTYCDMGAYNATGTKQMAIWMKFISNFYGLACCNGIVSLTGNTDSRGLFQISRTSSTTNFLQKSSTRVDFTETLAVPTVEVYIGGRNSDGVNSFFGANREYAFAYLGGALSTSLANTFNTRIQTLQTSLGRNV